MRGHGKFFFATRVEHCSLRHQPECLNRQERASSWKKHGKPTTTTERHKSCGSSQRQRKNTSLRNPSRVVSLSIDLSFLNHFESFHQKPNAGTGFRLPVVAFLSTHGQIHHRSTISLNASCSFFIGDTRQLYLRLHLLIEDDTPSSIRSGGCCTRTV